MVHVSFYRCVSTTCSSRFVASYILGHFSSGFLIVFEVFLYIVLNLLEPILRWIFKFPRHEERIFGQCFLMAYYLTNKEKMRAIREVDDFIMHLSVFAKNKFNYPKGKMYAPEFNLLINGKNQIKRMLFFSQGNISEILTSFGLALIHNEDHKAYSSVKQLIEETQKYGKLEGRFHVIVAQTKKYDVVVTWILLLIPIILAILGILPYT